MLNIRGYQMRDMCRVCLSGDGALADLYSDSQRLGRPIVEALRACAPIQITKNDGLPALICKLCYMKLDLFTQFQISALKSDEILRRYRDQLQQNNTSSASQDSPPNVDIDIVEDIKSENEESPSDNQSNDATAVNPEVSEHNLETSKSSNNDICIERVKSEEISDQNDSEEMKSEELLKNTTVDSNCDKIKTEIKSEDVTPQESSFPDNLSTEVNNDTLKDVKMVISNGLTKKTNNGLVVSIKEKLKTIDVNEIASNNDLKQENCVLKENDEKIKIVDANEVASNNGLEQKSCVLKENYEKLNTDANEIASNNYDLKQKSCVLNKNDAVSNKSMLNGSVYSRNSVQNKIDVSEFSLETNYNLRLKRKEISETVTHIPHKEIKLNTNKSSTANVNRVLQTKESSSSKTIESRNHLTGVSKESVVAENLLECNVCKRVFDCTSALNIHKLFHTVKNNYLAPNVSKVAETSKNIIEEPYRCDVCSKRFKEMAILTKHKLLHSQANMVNDSNDQINTSNKSINKQIDSCSSKEQSKNGKQRLERCFGCGICDKRFFTSASLEVHQRIHQKRTFECTNIVNECNDQTNASNKSINKQIDSCSSKEQSKNGKQRPERCFGCDICDKRFFTSANLEVHQRIHQKQTFECSICTKQFTDEYRYKEHKRKHKKLHRCNICKRKFAFIKNFNNHRKTHTS